MWGPRTPRGWAYCPGPPDLLPQCPLTSSTCCPPPPPAARVPHLLSQPRPSLVVKHDVGQPDALSGDPQDVDALVAGDVPGQTVVGPLLHTRARPCHSEVAATKGRPWRTCPPLRILCALTCFSQTLVVMICSRSFWGGKRGGERGGRRGHRAPPGGQPLPIDAGTAPSDPTPSVWATAREPAGPMLRWLGPRDDSTSRTPGPLTPSPEDAARRAAALFQPSCLGGQQHLSRSPAPPNPGHLPPPPPHPVFLLAPHLPLPTLSSSLPLDLPPCPAVFLLTQAVSAARVNFPKGCSHLLRLCSSAETPSFPVYPK